MNFSQLLSNTASNMFGYQSSASDEPDPLEQCLGEKAKIELLLAHCSLELSTCQEEESVIPALLTWQFVAYTSLGSVGLSVLLAILRAIWLMAFITEFPLDR
jgi:hypothetical protein